MVFLKEIERCKSNCLSNDLESFFSRGWLEHNIFLEVKRRKAHPLFWILVDEIKSKELADNLKQIPQPHLNRLIVKLKDGSDEFNLHATLTEVQVLPYYFAKSSKNYIVSHEDLIPATGKKPDIQIQTKSEKYYGEILTIFQDETDIKLDNIQEDIREKIDELTNNPFVVSFGLELNFEKDYIGDFLKFSENLIISNPKLKEKYNFKANGQKLAYVMFSESKKGKGFTGFMNGPARMGDDSGRIKNKLLDKTEQLPPKSKNFIVINLSYMIGGQPDFENVFFGQLAVNINKETHEAKPVNLPNSILNHSKGKRISAFIVYKGDYKKRQIYLNLSSENPINKNELNNI